MDRENVNTELDNLAYRLGGLSQEESRALLTAIELTSYSTFHLMLMKKKDLSAYCDGSKEYELAKEYNKGIQAVLNILCDCFKDDEDESSNSDQELEWKHNDYVARCSYDY